MGLSGVHFAAVELAGIDPNGTALLGDVELRRARSFGSEELRTRFIAGRVAQRLFAARLLGVPPARLRAVYACPECGSGAGTDHGRPGYWFNGAPTGLRLSLSRSAGWVLLAGLAGPGYGLGVDLQEVAGVDFDGFDSVALTARERTASAGLRGPEREAFRARAWAAKEAIVKASGAGLRMDPATVDSSGIPGVEVSLLDTAALALPPGFAAAAAVFAGEAAGS